MFIAMFKWFINIFVKSYKHENIYIFITSVASIAFSIASLCGFKNGTNISWVANCGSIIHILLLLFSTVIFVFIILETILEKKKLKSIINDRFWFKRTLSYIISAILLAYLVDLTLFDFINRWNYVTKPTDSTSTLDTMIYFMKYFQINFKDGIKTTISLSLLGTLFGLIIAFGLVSLRMLKVGPYDNYFSSCLKRIGIGFSKIYVTLIRGTPMVVQAFIFYYLVLSIFQNSLSAADYQYFISEVWTPYRAGLFTVSVNTAAYLTEVLRGGITSVDKGQKEAAEALGLNKFQTMFKVVFPQAIKNSLPSIGNEFIVNIKDTSVLTLIGILELFSVGKNDILGIYSGKSLEAYLIVAIYYLILTFLTSKLLQYIEKKMDVPVKEITSSN